MKKIWFMRHQAGGVLSDFPFAEQPTTEQIAPLRALMNARHGTHHPKTKEEFWFAPYAVDVLEPGDIPSVKIPGSGPAAMGGNTAHGVGTVTNPK